MAAAVTSHDCPSMSRLHTILAQAVIGMKSVAQSGTETALPAPTSRPATRTLPLDGGTAEGRGFGPAAPSDRASRWLGLRARGSHSCYNRAVTSFRQRLHFRQWLHPAWLQRRLAAGSRTAPVLVLGVIVIAILAGGLLLGSVLAAGGGPTASPGVLPGSATPSASASSSDPAPSPSPSPSPSATPAAPTVGPSPTPPLSGYVWPLPNGRVTLPFGPTSWGELVVNGQLFHDGVDMSTTCGDQVHAAHDGVVLAASRHYDDYMGWVGDLTPYYHLLDTKGWWNSLPIVIVIDDLNGYRSIYAHESLVAVKPGQYVTAGEVIGYEGATGHATGCHVHFGLFSPTETATFQLEPSIVKRDLLPAYEIARINPLLVLPFRCDIEEMRALRPAEAAACPVLPTPVPAAKPTATTRPTVLPTSSLTAQPSGTAAASPTG